MKPIYIVLVVAGVIFGVWLAYNGPKIGDYIP